MNPRAGGYAATWRVTDRSAWRQSFEIRLGPTCWHTIPDGAAQGRWPLDAAENKVRAGYRAVEVMEGTDQRRFASTISLVKLGPTRRNCCAKSASIGL